MFPHPLAVFLLAGSAASSKEITGIPPCEALAAAGFGEQLLLPTDREYEPQIQTWWAENSRLHPWCLILPRTSAEVSLALTTLLDAGNGAGGWAIAVKSGGHMSIPDSNNIADGVTIDLSIMNSSSYDQGTNTARVEPGARWENVYGTLQEQGVTVVGGRDGDVGVGGFLLGGGLSFFTPKLGFGCDSVVNFEVVLANGSIINANETANPDLWKALKGGSSNFGIVTRFDLEAIPSKELHYDLRFLAATYSNIVVDTVVEFANHDESLGDNALVTFLTHDMSISQDRPTIGVIHVNTAGDNNELTSFDRLKGLPSLVNVTMMQTMAQAAASSKLDAGTRNSGSTQTFKNDPVILRHCIQLHEEYVQELTNSIGPDRFKTLVFFQPVPSYLGRISGKSGGNMLGMGNWESNAVMWTGGVALTDSNDEVLAVAQALLNKMSAQIKDFAESVGGSVDLIYLNYADASQDPLGSYGRDQVQFLRDVATKYDPSGAFQTRIPGGFKIGGVP